MTVIDKIKRKQHEYLKRTSMPSKYIICDPTTRDAILYEGREFLPSQLKIEDIHTIFGLRIALVFNGNKEYLEVAG